MHLNVRPHVSIYENSVLYNSSNAQLAGKVVHIATVDGEAILTFAPTKTYQSIVVSTSELANDESYMIYVGESATGDQQDGIKVNGTYNGGREVYEFTVSSIVTGNAMMGGMMPGGRPNRP
jgi:hypothetical protein